MAQPTPVPHTDHEPEEKSIDLDKLLKIIAPVTLGILVLSFAFLWFQNKDTGLRAEVAQAYSTAQTPESLEAIAEVYPEQPEAPLALLQAGSLQFNDGKFEAAHALYTSFIERYPSHPLLENAEWGIWMSTEQMGELDVAFEGFSSVREEQLLYPQALMGLARIHEKKNELEAALEVYSQIQDEFPETPWAEQARVFAEQVELERVSPDA